MPLNMAPWIGRQYGRSDEEENRFGFRLLVVGESHYKTERDREPWFGLTTGVVERRVGGKCRQPFFTTMTKVLNQDQEDVGDPDFSVWQEVAFYNYIQSFRCGRISQLQWEEAQAPWQVVLKYLQPDAVLVASCAAAHRIRRNHQGLLDPDRLAVVAHPRAGGQWTIRRRIEVFQQLMNRVQKRLENIPGAVAGAMDE